MRYLSRGDCIGVVAPGFAVRRRELDAGVARLRAWGFEVVLGRHVLERQGYLAGDDRARGADLDAMIRDPRIDAIWFARGGYGTARLLEAVPWRQLRRRPKLLLGYSDATAFFAAAVERARTVCLYGPAVSELGDDRAWHRPSLHGLMRGRAVTMRLRTRDVLVSGRAGGRLFGGNLCVLTHLCGTPYQPDGRGGILFLEDVGEATYRLDRMLTQLDQAGVLHGVAGVVLGRFDVPPRRRFPTDRPLAEVLGERFAGRGMPVVQGIPAGHGPGKRTLPLGARVEIDTAARTLRLTP